MTICERMFIILNKGNKKQTELCEYLGINTSTLTTWKKKNTDPPARYLSRICEFLDITIFELLGIENTELTQKEKELLNKYKILPEEKQELILNMVQTLAKDYDTDSEITRKEA